MDSLLLGEAKCEVTIFRCDNSVAWLVSHQTACKILYCEEHAQKMKNSVLLTHIRGGGLRCLHCKKEDINPSECTFIRI